MVGKFDEQNSPKPQEDTPNEPDGTDEERQFLNRKSVENEFRRKEGILDVLHWVRLVGTIIFAFVALALGSLFSAAIAVHYLGPDEWGWLSESQLEDLKTFSTGATGAGLLMYIRDKIKTLW